MEVEAALTARALAAGMAKAAGRQADAAAAQLPDCAVCCAGSARLRVFPDGRREILGYTALP